MTFRALSVFCSNLRIVTISFPLNVVTKSCASTIVKKMDVQRQRAHGSTGQKLVERKLLNGSQFVYG